jgi:hypothetical protein
MRESDQCFTPPHIFQTLRLQFDVDVAAPPGGVEWIPAKRFFTEADDGLTQPWKGRVWMNPPFSDPSQWVNKFVAHGNGVGLIHVSKSRWFRNLWDSACSIVFPEPHLKFVKFGKPHGIFMPIVVIAAGKVCEKAIARLGVVR